MRGQTVQYALSGLVGLALSAYVVSKTGRAEDFFLPGLLANAAYALAYLISILVRWPLLGVIVATLRGAGMGWRKDPAQVRDVQPRELDLGRALLAAPRGAAAALPRERAHRARRRADRDGHPAVRGRDLALLADPAPDAARAQRERGPSRAREFLAGRSPPGTRYEVVARHRRTDGVRHTIPATTSLVPLVRGHLAVAAALRAR